MAMLGYAYINVTCRRLGLCLLKNQVINYIYNPILRYSAVGEVYVKIVHPLARKARQSDITTILFFTLGH